MKNQQAEAKYPITIEEDFWGEDYDINEDKRLAFNRGWDAAMKEREIFREVVEFMRDYCNPTEPGLFETYANLLMNAEAALDRS